LKSRNRNRVVVMRRSPSKRSTSVLNVEEPVS
jgi:hypothetical protein